MMKKYAALAVVALAALAITTSATAASGSSAFTYDKDLRWWVQASLETVTHNQGTMIKRIPKSVYIRCYSDRWAFEEAMYRMGASPEEARYTIAYYLHPPYGNGSTINVRAGTCAQAREFVSGHVTQTSAGAFHTLLHEALHRQGFHSEKLTEAFAITTMHTAGQLVAYNQAYEVSAETAQELWERCSAKGDRAMWLAWQQSQQMIALNYHSSWESLPTDSWADRLGL
jgi:hypothetical protein